MKLPARSDDPIDGYINANYINSSRGDKIFIAAQGPLPQTRENFWRMVVQEKVNLIVMLTGLKENGKIKCDQYWPSSETGEYTFDHNSLVVQLISEEVLMPGLIRRQFKINQSQVLTQLQYETWPDHGAPEQKDFKLMEVLLLMISEC